MSSPGASVVQVPLKWTIRSIESGVSVNAADVPATGDELGVLKTSCVYSGSFNVQENKTVLPEERARVACPVSAGALIVSRMNTPDLVGATGYAQTSHANVFLPDRLWQVRFDEARVCSRYVYWWTQSNLYRDQVRVACAGASSSMQNLDQDSFRRFMLPQVERSQQERIANFLDEQTARIDALIAEKQELLARLEEYLEASIARRILGDDQPGPRTKTNVPEVPELPAGWVLSPMMRLTDPKRPIMYGIVLPGPNVEEGPSVPIVKGGDVRPHRLRLELLNRTTPEIEAPYARARLAPGDIVYSIRGTIGDAELVPLDLAGANITQDVARIAPRAGVDNRWLLFAAKSHPVFAQLEQLSLGAAVRGINIFDLKRARVPTPPPALQKSIALELAALRARVEALQQHCTLHIDRLREYRSSLISTAVTGQIEVGAFNERPRLAA